MANWLDQGSDLPRRVVLDDLVHGPDVDAELEGRGRDKAFDLPALESRLDPLALLAGQRAVVDRDILTDHREAGAEELRQGTRGYEDEGGPALIKRIVDRGEAGSRLRGDVQVAGGLEVLVDGTRPFDAVLVSFLEGREEDFEGLLVAEERGDCVRVAYRGGKADSLEITLRDATEPLEGDRELAPAPICRVLIDLVDDDVSDRPETP